MKKVNLERLNMLQAVVQFGEATAQESSMVPNFASVINNIKTLTGDLFSLGEVVVSEITSYTTYKNEVKERFIDKLYYLTMGLKAYANETQNTILYGKVNFSISNLRRRKEAPLAMYGGEVINLVTPLVGNLYNHGITQANVDEVVALRQEFKDLISSPRTKRSERSTTSEQMETALRQAMAMANFQLDPNAFQLRVVNPEWFRGYKYSRRIVPLGNQHTKVKGLIVNAQMQPLFNATVVLKNLSGEEVHTSTMLNGHFEFANIKQGFYQVSVEKDGFAPFVSAEFQVKKGKQFIVDAALESLVMELKKVA